MSEPSEQTASSPQPVEKVPEYERPLLLICAICGLGPFALPLVWRHPRMKWYWKLYITFLVVGVTWGCIVLTKVMFDHLRQQWEIFQELSS